MCRSRRIFLSLFLSALYPALIRAQAQAGPMVRPAEPPRVYDDSAAGLRLQLQDALAAARSRDRPALESFIHQMEIPNSAAWFTKSYGQAKGEGWAESYRRELANRERDLEVVFLEYGIEAGEFATRQVNNAPEPGMEAGMIAELQQPKDIFYAAWRKRESPPNSKDEPIGYFVFLEGRFRWDSTIVLLKIQQDETRNPPVVQGASPGSTQASSGQRDVGKNDGIARPGVNGVTYPKCFYCPDPHYPPQARAQHLDGNVVLSVVVEPDGTAGNIELVKTSDPVFVDMAMEAVRKWRFKPAVDANGQMVPVRVPVEVTFRISYGR